MGKVTIIACILYTRKMIHKEVRQFAKVEGAEPRFHLRLPDPELEFRIAALAAS